jgi:hypothetical protein
MCEDYKETLEKVKESNMYITCEEILRRINTEKFFNKKKPADKKITVNTEDLYKKYFRSREGKDHR